MSNFLKRVACVGDSLTEGHGSSNPATMSYPAQMQQILGNTYDIRNFGIGARTGMKDGMEGDGSPRGFVREQQYRDSLDFLPDLVLLMFGTNDTKEINRPLIPEHFSQDMEELVCSYLRLSSHPSILLLTPPFVVHPNWTITEECVVQDIIPRICTISKKLLVPCIDVHQYTFGHSEYYTEDGVHLNDFGYTKLATYLSSFVK